MERFHQTVDRFIEEIRLAHVHSIGELNRKWKVFLEEDYQKKAHDGIARYYQSQGVEVPPEGISPLVEFNRDERRLKYVDVNVVSEAFTRKETRKIDEAGCFSFGGTEYEASAAYANLEVEIAYDPLDTRTVTVRYGNMEEIKAHPVSPAVPALSSAARGARISTMCTRAEKRRRTILCSRKMRYMIDIIVWVSDICYNWIGGNEVENLSG